MAKIIKKGQVFGIIILIISLMFAGMPGNVSAEFVGDVTINADGTVTPAGAPISISGTTYTLTDDIAGSITINKAGITLDGNNHKLTGTGTGTGIYQGYIHYNTIKNFDITGFEYGIFLSGSQHTSLIDNTITNSDLFGIYLYGGGYATLTGNTVTDGNFGIYHYYSSQCTLRKNVMSNNSYNFGVYGWGWGYLIEDIDTSNTVDGKPIYYWVGRSHETIPSDAGAVGLISSDNITVSGLTLENNGVAMVLGDTKDITIENNIIQENNIGISMSYSSYSSVSSNTFNNNGYAISNHAWSNYNQFSGNTFNNNIRSINTQTADFNVYTGNTFAGDANWAFSMSTVNNDIVSENTFTGVYNGILLGGGRDNLIYNNEFLSGTGTAILIHVAFEENQIIGNYFYDNSASVTFTSGSSNQLVSDNVFTENYYAFQIYYGATQNQIINNELTLNSAAFRFYESDANIIAGNDLMSNYYGFIFQNSNNNVFYNNNIIDTTITLSTDLLSTNIWDNGEGEGNYWSDYTGSDTNGDGIGDTDLPHLGIDNYPLMEPWVSGYTIDGVIEQIGDMGLQAGIENSLVSKLANAFASIEKGQEGAAINKLEAFINECEAQRGNKLTNEQADALIEAAQWIVNDLMEA